MMGRLPARHEEEEENSVKKGPWTPEEDRLLVDYIKKHGHGSWRALPKLAGLNRCGKSCRLRWTNYLRPDIKRGKFTDEEEKLIINMHAVLGNKWSAIAGKLPGRTDNEIKNFWNTHLRKKLLQMGLDPVTHRPRTEHLDLISYLNQLLTAANIITGLTTNTWLNTLDPTHQSPNKFQMLQTMLQFLSSSSSNNNNDNNNNHVPNIQSLLSNNSNHNTDILPLEPILPPLPNEIYEALGLNNHNVANVFPLPSPHQNLTSFQNFDSPNGTSCMYQKLDDDEQVVLDAIANSDPTSSSPPFSNNNSLPNLVSASSPPECSNANKIMKSNDDDADVMIHPNEFSSPSSSSATFPMWGSDFMYEEANDAYWNGLLGGRGSNQP